ncbi:MAG: tRNA lysidine(34) synthetase TilS [Bacteroidetes bacterium]|nr:tRNA lysidine(34) synthetase TilS [Bacteroidota bacterium]
MNIRQTVEKTMRSFGLSPATRVFLAISGGIDSVVLAHLLRVSGYQAIWLHMNFQLRGEESHRDQQFVEQLAKKWDQTLHTLSVNAKAFAEENKLSTQEAARTLRYNWFAAEVKPAGKQAVLLTAHHAEDNAETLLMNFLRGTGLRGLTAIPAVNDYICRPLLHVSRSQIMDYARENELDFVEDSSNRNTDYTRNRLRLELMPILRDLYPQVDANLKHNIDRFQSAYALYQQAARRWMKKHIVVKGAEQQVSCALLLQPENRAIVHEWLVGHGFTEKQEDELLRLGESQSGHFLVSADGKYRIIKHRNHFLLTAVQTDSRSPQWIGAEDSVSVFSGGRLEIKPLLTLTEPLPCDPRTACLDVGELDFPLLLRPWQPGDYFYPLGLNKKKKLARFLIDLKLSTPQKERVWVLESGNRIVWVIGYRIDHRFRVRAQSREVVQIDWVV